jgi:hypothetical protein
MKELIIQLAHGGLGDHLFFSHIPRIAKESGRFDKVFFSEKSLVRSQAIIDLVWKSNPYIDGVTSESGRMLDLEMQSQGNILDYIMLAYGLDDGCRFHEPELYIETALKSELKNLTIYDPNYISYIGSVNKCKLKNIVCANSVDAQLAYLGRGFPIKDILPVISTSSLFEYCNLIKSVKTFLCFTSGSATLASALKVPAVAMFGNGQNKIFHHSKSLKYIDVGDYSFSGNVQSHMLKFSNRIRYFSDRILK